MGVVSYYRVDIDCAAQFCAVLEWFGGMMIHASVAFAQQTALTPAYGSPGD
jgi:hypothetical protein